MHFSVVALVTTCFCVNAWSLTSVASDTIEVSVNLKSFTLGSGIPSNPKSESQELNEVAVWNGSEDIDVFLRIKTLRKKVVL